MRYFIDPEFNARGNAYPVDLISIAIVAEDGRELICRNASFNPDTATPFVRDHVLPHLPAREMHATYSINRRDYERPKAIRERIKAFVGDDASPEFWGYYCAFDYVILSQLMGGMDAWPAGWPYYMRDLRQWLDEHGYSDVCQADDAAHDALSDARWIASAHQAFVLGTSTTSWGGPLNRVAITTIVPKGNAA